MTTMQMNQVSHAAVPSLSNNGERAPRKAVYVITERMFPEGSRSFWTRVGVAFENRDGSLTLKLDALPLSGTLQVREDDRDRGERGDHQARAARAAAAPF